MMVTPVPPCTHSVAKDGILTIRFDNPARRNAFTPEMRRRAAQALQEAVAGRVLRVVVIEGEGGHFSTGADLSGLGDISNLLAGPAVAARLNEALAFYRDIAAGPLPVIAKVAGDCFGAGCSLAMACDFVVATPQSRFGMAFGQRGLLPDFGMLRSLAQRVGPQRAKQMLLLSEVLGGTAAFGAGLVDRLCPPAQIDAEVAALAAQLAQAAPRPVAAIRAAYGAGLASCDDVAAFEIPAAVAISQSRDFHEGLTAFREKRPPLFTGE